MGGMCSSLAIEAVTLRGSFRLLSAWLAAQDLYILATARSRLSPVHKTCKCPFVNHLRAGAFSDIFKSGRALPARF